MDQAPAVIFAKDLHGRYLSINPAGVTLIGRSEGEIVGRSDADLFSAELAAALHADDLRVQASGTAEVSEATFPDPTGPRTWLVQKFPLRTAGGEIYGVGGVATETTKIVGRHRLSGEESRLLAQRFTLATEAASIGIWDWDLHADRWYASPTYFTLLGYAPEEGFSDREIWIERVHPEDRENVSAKIGAVLKGDLAPYRYEARLRHADGSYRWIAVEGRVLARDEHGRPLRMLGIRADISERRQAEEVAQRSERRFRSLIEKSTDVVALLDPAGALHYHSPAVTAVLGYSVAELEGKEALSLAHPEDAAHLAGMLQRLRGVPFSSEKIHCRFRHQDGTYRWLEGTATNLNEEPGVQAIVLNYRDVSDRRLLEQELRQAQKLESIGQLAGGIAHDFNNLLTVITGHVSLLKLLGREASDTADSLREIGAAADRAANLTRQLLAFSRRQVMQLRDLDLNGVVENVTKMLRRLVGENVTLQFHAAAQPLVIHADPGMMEQLLLNLAVNARDAMPRGGKLGIALAAADLNETAPRHPEGRPGRYACLSITDSGSGIAPEILPHIFEPFFTTKDIGQGSGLGLATVYGIVRQHEGWIEVSSQLAAGTTFRIYLPRCAEALPKPSPETPGPEIARGKETILLVEDEPAVRAMMRLVLSRHGYRVLEAPTGVVAREIWARHRGDIRLLLTDLVMPDGMTGQELAQLLTGDSPGLRVIFTSGYSAEIAGRDFPLKEGVNFLAKPFEATRLTTAVRTTLDAR